MTRRIAAAALVAALGGVSPIVRAQSREPSSPPVVASPDPSQAPAAPAAADDPNQRPPLPQERFGRMSARSIVRIGQDYTLGVDETVRDVAVIIGTTTIAGHVEGDVNVILGAVQVAPTAVIDGSLVVVGGGATIAPGASVGRDFVVVGGVADAPPNFSPGGDHVVIGPMGSAGTVHVVTPWLTRGLLWGRLLVPDLPWVWALLGIVFLIYLAITVLFDRPVRTCTATIAARPFSAFLVGLLVLVLAGPVTILLAVSLVGIVIIPVLACALLIAALIGRIAVARWIGHRIIAESDEPSTAEAVRSFVIGFAVIAIAYMVPLLGIVTWALVGVTGLGAAVMALLSTYRRESRVGSQNVTAAPGVGAEPAPVALESALVPLESAPATGPSGIASSSIPSAPAATASSAFSSSDTSDAAPFTSGEHAQARAAAGPAHVPPALPYAAAGAAALPHAPLTDRLAAVVADLVLVFIVTALLESHAGDGRIFLLLLVYHVGFWTWKQTTIGGMLCQLRIVRTNGLPLTFGDALVRGLASVLSVAAAGIGFLWILKDPERQAWHDRIAGTYVVKVPHA